MGAHRSVDLRPHAPDERKPTVPSQIQGYRNLDDYVRDTGRVDRVRKREFKKFSRLAKQQADRENLRKLKAKVNKPTASYLQRMDKSLKRTGYSLNKETIWIPSETNMYNVLADL